MRESQIKKTPFTLILGDKEKESNTVSYRRYSSSATVNLSLRQYIKDVRDEIEKKC